MVLLTRKRLATELEEPRQATAHLALWASLEERLKPFNDLISQDWFGSVETLRMPQLTDVLVLERAERSVRQYVALPERQYDEKFHILQAPSLFLSDLAYLGRLCELRNRATAVVFIDVDNFKPLNTTYGETDVDLRVLPILMRCLESFVFGRGYAYKLGGDEYLALLPNCDRPTGIFLLDRLRREIRNLEYPGIREALTVSVGLCVLEPNASLTDREAQERANRAKNYAKREARDRVATYQGAIFRDDELEIVSAG